MIWHAWLIGKKKNNMKKYWCKPRLKIDKDTMKR